MTDTPASTRLTDEQLASLVNDLWNETGEGSPSLNIERRLANAAADHAAKVTRTEYAPLVAAMEELANSKSVWAGSYQLAAEAALAALKEAPDASA